LIDANVLTTDETVMCKADSGAEYAAWPWFDPQRRPMERDAGSRSVGVECDREPDKDKHPDTLLNPPRQPQIQAAAAEIVKDGVLFEWLIVDVDAPNRGWKRRLDT
jgi:hypothetical protein